MLSWTKPKPPRMKAPELLPQRAQQARAVACNVPSPCTSVCRIHPETGWCEGCWRSVAEITEWSRASDERKREVWHTIEARVQAAGV